jgi:hypothetical protein
MLREEEYTVGKKTYEAELGIVEWAIVTGCYCMCCGYIGDPWDFQKHHVAGRKHGDMTIVLCHICHNRFSRTQRHYPKAWLERDLPPKLRAAFMLRGQSEVLAAFSKNLRQLSDKMLDEKEGDG